MITCPHCGATKGQQKRGFSPSGAQLFQYTICKRKYNPAAKTLRNQNTPRQVIHCAQCGKETTNPKFCSRSCNAIYNNHHFPKKKAAQKFCKHCGALISKGRSVCDKCNPSYVDWSSITIGEIRKSAKYQFNAQIREVARTIFKASGRPRICQNCGYSKHIEVCHIQAVNTFSDDTPVAQVSGLENLVALCPNCHWEFDHGLLKYEDIPPLATISRE